jgi:hypothetical protein
MPAGALVLKVEMQGPVACIWYELDTKDRCIPRTFKILGTGQPIPDKCVHVGTYQDPPYVWHLYEDLNHE